MDLDEVIGNLGVTIFLFLQAHGLNVFYLSVGVIACVIFVFFVLFTVLFIYAQLNYHRAVRIFAENQDLKMFCRNMVRLSVFDKPSSEK